LLNGVNTVMRALRKFLLGQISFQANYSDDSGFNFGGAGGRRSAGSGCASGCLSNPRVLLALVMIVGYVGYYYLGTAEYENPITGRKQRLAMATPEEEIAMGLQSAPSMIREFGGEHPNQEDQATLDRVGERLVNSTMAKNTPYQFEFHLLRDDKTVNAFALPGGQIFITAKLFSLLNEDQLAGVIGHEIGHVVGRHSNQQMAKGKAISGVFQAIGMLLSDGSGAGGMQVAQMVGNVVNMKYGREDELESDALGVRFLMDAGYNPEAMIGVMEILAENAGGGGQPEIMSTHPDPGNRVEHIKAEIANYRAGRPTRIPSAESGASIK
jgi:predicted Zn-dependent protease